MCIKWWDVGLATALVVNFPIADKCQTAAASLTVHKCRGSDNFSLLLKVLHYERKTYYLFNILSLWVELNFKELCGGLLPDLSETGPTSAGFEVRIHAGNHGHHSHFPCISMQYLQSMQYNKHLSDIMHRWTGFLIKHHTTAVMY